jgi:DNA-binding transcriptional regulator YhcF (GntR family)
VNETVWSDHEGTLQPDAQSTVGADGRARFSVDLRRRSCTIITSTPVHLPFSIALRPGRPLHEQVVFAVTKAIITGQLCAGDRFPSVRTLSQELEINPNTAQKAVGTLVERGLLEVQPGIGTMVAAWRPTASAGRRALLHEQIERLVVDAKRLGLDLGDVIELLRREWP